MTEKKRTSARRPGRAASIVDTLRPEEAGAVLRTLLGRRPDLAADVARIVEDEFGDTDAGEVADCVETSLRSLTLHDFGDRGQAPWGYVPPGEAADEILEDVIKPHCRVPRRSTSRKPRRRTRRYCVPDALPLGRNDRNTLIHAVPGAFVVAPFRPASRESSVRSER